MGQRRDRFELAAEAERISERLAVLATVARLWKLAADASAGTGVEADDRPEVLGAWLAKALENRRRLSRC